MGRAVAARRRGGKASAPFHVVLLAGGGGTRFWPMSRRKRPKQFLALGGRTSLLRQTWDRVRVLAPPSRIWVVAPKALAPAVRRELPALRAANLVVEPSPRDTGPAIALACAVIRRKDPEAVVAVFPTDHVIRDRRAFARAVTKATEAASGGALVCLGVEPDRPSTGFGYLRVPAARPRARSGAVRVLRFVEKPDAASASRFLRSGRYLWNAGMFVFAAQAFFEELRRVAPALERAATATAAGRPAAWSSAPRISIDHALLEKAHRVLAVVLDAGWDDVGSWEAAARLARGAADGAHVLVDSPGSVVFGQGRLVAILGLPGIVVVDTPDALLVAARDGAERVKELVAELRRRGREGSL